MKGMSQRLPEFQQWVYSTQTGFWAVFLAHICTSYSMQHWAFGGHVADIFHLFVFDPTLGTGRLLKKKLCLIYAELGLFAEKTHYGSLIVGRAGLHSGAFFGRWCCSAVLTGLLGWRLGTFFRSSSTQHLLVFHFMFQSVYADPKRLHLRKMKMVLHFISTV